MGGSKNPQPEGVWTPDLGDVADRLRVYAEQVRRERPGPEYVALRLHRMANEIDLMPVPIRQEEAR